MTDNLWTLKDLAAHFQVSLNTARKLPIAFTRIGNQRRYHPKVVARYELWQSNQPKAWKDGVAA